MVQSAGMVCAVVVGRLPDTGRAETTSGVTELHHARDLSLYLDSKFALRVDLCEGGSFMENTKTGWSRNSRIVGGAVITVVIVTTIMSTVGKEFTVLQSVIMGLVFGVVTGLTALIIGRILNRSKQTQ